MNRVLMMNWFLLGGTTKELLGEHHGEAAALLQHALLAMDDRYTMSPLIPITLFCFRVLLYSLAIWLQPLAPLF